MTPRNRLDALFGPSCKCVNAAKMTLNAGKGEIRPLSCGPSASAIVVSSTTRTVALRMRPGRSHQGGARRPGGSGYGLTRRAAAAMTISSAASAGQSCQATRLSVKVEAKKAVIAPSELSGQAQRCARAM